MGSDGFESLTQQVFIALYQNLYSNMFCFLVGMYFYNIAFMFPFFLDVRFDCYFLLLLSKLIAYILFEILLHLVHALSASFQSHARFN